MTSTVTTCLRVIEIIKALATMNHYFNCLAGLLCLPLPFIETMDTQPECIQLHMNICCRSVTISIRNQNRLKFAFSFDHQYLFFFSLHPASLCIPCLSKRDRKKQTLQRRHSIAYQQPAAAIFNLTPRPLVESEMTEKKN